MKERLQGLEIPKNFSKREVARDAVAKIKEGEGVLSEQESQKLGLVIAVLKHPETNLLIDEGKLTLGIIKPDAYAGLGLPEDDQEAADYLIDEIGDKAVFDISIQLTRDQAETFYAPNKEKMEGKTTNNGVSVWDSVTTYSSSGPVTFVLIFDEEGKAVEWWRNKMGKTRANEADPDSIRGKHALVENLPNNLVHGSDAREEAKREIGVLADILCGIKIKNDKNKILHDQLNKKIGEIPTASSPSLCA